MTDTVPKKKRSEIMSRIRSTNTIFEYNFRKELWRRGFRYRKNIKSMVGKPDIFFPRKKIVVFLDSCFWHGCKLHCRMPKSNVEYWREKIERNKKRDSEVTSYYKNNDFTILRFWEHEVRENMGKIMNKVESAIKRIEASEAGFP